MSTLRDGKGNGSGPLVRRAFNLAQTDSPTSAP